jgi:enoyl-CoA hydratase/carnithine racemase
MIRGYAVGVGIDLALGCDFRIAERGAQMGALFVKRELGGGAAYLLPRFVGLGKATELLLLGDKDAIEGPRAFAERRQPEFTGEWIDAIE